jgi:predicted acylesterase/phospholipase RssA
VFEVDQVLNGEIPDGDDQRRFDYQKLESAVQSLVERRLNDPNAIMADTNQSPAAKNVPTFVVATKGLHADGPPTLFRSYQCRGHNADKCAIWEAARATSAAPTFFKSIRIEEPPPGATFVDGGFLYNNPAELALSEAHRIWTTVKYFCLVSVGTGRLKSVKVVDVRHRRATNDSHLSNVRPSNRRRVEEIESLGLSTLRKIGEICVQLATSSEPVHDRLFKQSESHDPDKQFPYHRFNVERDMDEIELQEWDQMELIGEHTAAYMEEVEGESKQNKCVQELMNPPPRQRMCSSSSFK